MTVVPVCVDSVASVLVPVAEVSGVASDDDGFCSLDCLRPLPSARVMGMMTADGFELDTMTADFRVDDLGLYDSSRQLILGSMTWARFFYIS